MTCVSSRRAGAGRQAGPGRGAAFEHRSRRRRAPGWVRAELFVPDRAAERKALCDRRDTTYCRNKLGVTAMTSAIYVR